MTNENLVRDIPGRWTDECVRPYVPLSPHA